MEQPAPQSQEKNAPLKSIILQKVDNVVSAVASRIPTRRVAQRWLLALIGPSLLATACDFNPQPTVAPREPTPIVWQTPDVPTSTPLSIFTPEPTLVPPTATTVATSTPEPTASPTETPEPAPAKNIVNGIEVYGLQKPINTEADFISLNNYFQEQFNLKLNQIYQRQNIASTNDRWQQRELVLQANQRYLQIVVKKSVYENFKKNNQDNVTFPEWCAAEMQQMNDFISAGSPHVDLRIVLSRIVVVDDSFDDRLKEHKTIPDSADDIDSSWSMWSDYRGDKNPITGVHEASPFLGVASINNRKIMLDYGLLHELDHQLLNWPDEYIQNVERLDEIGPALTIEGAGGMFSRSPWFYFDLQRIQSLKIRGYYTDPRGIGTLGTGQNSDFAKTAALNIWSERPSTNQFTFLDSKGQPLSGTVTILRNHNNGTDYYGEKHFAVAQTAQLVNGKLAMSDDCFTPDRGGYAAIYPTNFVFKITGTDGSSYLLQMPIAGFNMSKLAGVDDASYSVRFTGSNVTSNTRTEVLSMSQTQGPYEFAGLTTPYASMQVDGTPVTFTWGLSNQDLRYGQSR